MRKGEAENLINDSIIIEELAIPIYKKHFESSLFWSGFEEPDAISIRNDLEILIKESKEHMIILEKLKKINEGRQ